MTLKDCVNFLADNGYLVQHKHLFLLTEKFNSEVSGMSVGVKVQEKVEVKEPEAVRFKKPVKMKGGVEMEASTVDWMLAYQEFITDAKVPRIGTTRTGSYDLNKATKPGRKAFREALESGKEYDKLVEAAKSYYSKGAEFKVKIERYMVDELWASDYGKTQTTTSSRSNDGHVISIPRI